MDCGFKAMRVESLVAHPRHQMIHTTKQLLRWFSENDIPTEGFTLILNFQDAKAGSRFEAAMRREAGELISPTTSKPLDLFREFQMNGLKVKVESPLHDEDNLIRTYDPTIPYLDRMRRA
jgi:hypothetical protein